MSKLQKGRQPRKPVARPCPAQMAPPTPMGRSATAPSPLGRSATRGMDRNVKEDSLPQPPMMPPQPLPGAAVAPEEQGMQSEATGNGQQEGFYRCIEQMVTEYERSILVFRQENAELRRQNNNLQQRLMKVLNATWSFSGEKWTGSPHKPQDGNLTLMLEQKQDEAQSSSEAWQVVREKSTMADVEAGDLFQVRDAWNDSSRRSKKRRKSTQRSADMVSCLHDVPATKVVEGSGCSRRLTLMPNSNVRMAWDIVSSVMLVYDAVMIPLGAFTEFEELPWVIMDWATLLFWSCDMLLSFFTGYISRGVTHMGSTDIAKNYLRTWFPIDLLVIGPEWVFTVANEFFRADAGEGGSSVAEVFRILRIVRILRLLRLAKLKRLVALIKDHVQSEVILLLADFVKVVVVLFVLNHFVGSAWYLVGTLGKDASSTWIEVDGLANKPLFFRYVASMHWSFAHFALGSMLITPQNGGEYSFTIVVLILGIFVFSSLTAFITNKMIQLRDLQGETSRQFWILRRYLRQRHVPKHLFFRILRYTEYACSTQEEFIPESKVSFLSLLSEQLNQELKFQVHFSCLCAHPLFSQATVLGEASMHAMVDVVLVQRLLAYSDLVFSMETNASEMYFISSGRLIYTMQGSVDKMADKDDWLSEQVLWVHWRHRGDAVIFDTQCELLCVDSKAFRDVIEAELLLYPMISRYAHQFVDWMNKSRYEELTDLFTARESVSVSKEFIEAGRSQAFTGALDGVRGSIRSERSDEVSTASPTSPLASPGRLRQTAEIPSDNRRAAPAWR